MVVGCRLSVVGWQNRVSSRASVEGPGGRGGKRIDLRAPNHPGPSTPLGMTTLLQPDRPRTDNRQPTTNHYSSTARARPNSELVYDCSSRLHEVTATDVPLMYLPRRSPGYSKVNTVSPRLRTEVLPRNCSPSAKSPASSLLFA